jgi:hypothetical protein
MVWYLVVSAPVLEQLPPLTGNDTRAISAPNSGKTSLFNVLTGSRLEGRQLPGGDDRAQGRQISRSEGGAFCKQINGLVCKQKR